MDSSQHSGLSGWLRSRTGMVLLAFLLVVAFYLFTEHTAHTLNVLPFALVLLCPFMHLFMHGSHGGHGEHGNHPSHNDSGQVK